MLATEKLCTEIIKSHIKSVIYSQPLYIHFVMHGEMLHLFSNDSTPSASFSTVCQNEHTQQLTLTT